MSVKDGVIAGPHGNPLVGPHRFWPMRRFFNHDRCARCYLGEKRHPTKRYEVARPGGDKSRPVAR